MVPANSPVNPEILGVLSGEFGMEIVSGESGETRRSSLSEKARPKGTIFWKERLL